MRRSRWSALSVLAAAAVLAAGCAGSAPEEVSERDVSAPEEAGEPGGWLDGAPPGVAAEGDAAGRASSGAEVAAADEGSFAAPGAESSPAPEEPETSALRAGSVDDNERWEEYLLYREDFLRLGITVHDVDVGARQLVTVRTPDGAPVLGARVLVTDSAGEKVADLRTYADGRAMFFGEPSGDAQQGTTFQAVVEKGDAQASVDLDPEARQHEIALDAAPADDPVPLDVLFLIDATGSMADEIEQLKANMISVSEQIDELPTRPDVRFGMTVYRDRADEFVTRTFDFTDDVGTFTDALRDVVANGGGDVPESLNEGLHEALASPSWRGEEAVRMVFLVADAPPHLDYADDFDYAQEAQDAGRRGVKIHSVASSGLDDQGEFVFRQLAQLTLGRFNFLTYGADGAPGDETPHHVDEYDVLSLDELVVQLVSDELGHLTRS